MGRHTDTSAGLGATLSDLGAALSQARSTGRRAAPASRSLLSPAALRAGGLAAAVSLAVSGAAYATVQGSGGPGPSLTSSSANALALNGLEAASTVQAPTSGPTSFTLTVDGASTHATTGAATWGEALVRAGVVVDAEAGDTVSVALDDAPTDGATVTVNHAVSQVVSVEEAVPHTSTRQETTDLVSGQTKVGTAGKDGLARTTYRVTTVGGKEVSREPLSTVTLTEKVDEVVLVGTGTDTQAALAQAGPGTDAASAQAIAKVLVAQRGWGDSEFTCLVSLWNRESTWRYTAENASSGAYGIPQALPGSKMASAGADWRTNPTTQITWGLGYIAGRYRTPCAAWAHSEQTGWY